MRASSKFIPLALFMFAFSMGMDVHHTHEIEKIQEQAKGLVPAIVVPADTASVKLK